LAHNKHETFLPFTFSPELLAVQVEAFIECEKCSRLPPSIQLNRSINLFFNWGWPHVLFFKILLLSCNIKKNTH